MRSGIRLTGGLVYRQDANLELGAVTERVEVVAASEMINTSLGEVTNTVDLINDGAENAQRGGTGITHQLRNLCR